MTLTAGRPASRERRSPRPPGMFWLVAAGYVLHVGVRIALSWGRHSPVFLPDEAGYLVAGRWLAGGPGMDLTGQTFYQAGYSLLFTPVYWFTHSPATVYRTVLVLNAVVGALAFPLGRAFLVRCGLGRHESVLLAWAAAFLPAVTLYSTTAMTDAVLPVLVLGWLLALDRFVRTGGRAWGVASGLLAAYMYATHMRGMIILAVHCAVVAALFVLRRAPRVAAGWLRREDAGKACDEDAGAVRDEGAGAARGKGAGWRPA
ncbi:hypothetical protein DZF91_25825, partial [Actinomadura logoneensis]